jgi:N-acetylmuramoyl-L-alanine amidase
MRSITEIFIHCSDSTFGDVEEIRRWHLERGFLDIGYHFVILNGFIVKDKLIKNKDGVIEIGRPISQMGAHVTGRNKNSVGICLVGTNKFTEKQTESLLALVHELCQKYPIGMNIFGHYESASGKKQEKTCPNIDMEKFRLQYVDYRLQTEKE